MEAVKTEICLSEASLFPFSLQQTALAQPGAVLIFASFHQGKEGATLHKGKGRKKKKPPLHKGRSEKEGHPSSREESKRSPPSVKEERISSYLSTKEERKRGNFNNKIPAGCLYKNKLYYDEI